MDNKQLNEYKGLVETRKLDPNHPFEPNKKKILERGDKHMAQKNQILKHLNNTNNEL